MMDLKMKFYGKYLRYTFLAIGNKFVQKNASLIIQIGWHSDYKAFCEQLQQHVISVSEYIFQIAC